jgi:phosphoglycolate phosphatase-like HAD superfamily hydrolase
LGQDRIHNHADEVETHKAATNIADLIDGATTSEDAERSKPFPDIFEAAFAKLGLSQRTDAMVVGDTPYDVEAARAAGLSAIGVLCVGFTEQALRQAGCIAVYRNPQHSLEAHGGVTSGQGHGDRPAIPRRRLKRKLRVGPLLDPLHCRPV